MPGYTPLYLKADGNTNNTAYIYALSPTDITLVGGVTYGTGVTGQAFQFNDTAGERVVVSDTGELQAAAVTLSAWIDLNSLPGLTPYVIASRTYSATSENYGLYVNSAGELVFEWYSDGAFHTEISSGAALGSRLGAFQQVAVVTDGSTVTFYVNGVAVSSTAMPAPLDSTTSGNLEIGGLSQGPNLFDGLIDDLSVTLNTLPADEIARIYANGGAGTDLGGSGTEDTTVVGNFIGIGPDGATAIPNGSDGVEIDDALDNTIGGNTAGAVNLISGNTLNGVEIDGAHATGNVIEGDEIGTDITGARPVPNSVGVEIDTDASGNTIGGTVAGAGNVISGNTGDGVEITGSGATGNLVAGNLIGTNAAGSAALANGNAGVEIDGGATADTIGGSSTAARNVLSGNAFAGGPHRRHRHKRQRRGGQLDRTDGRRQRCTARRDHAGQRPRGRHPRRRRGDRERRLGQHRRRRDGQPRHRRRQRHLGQPQRRHRHRLRRDDRKRRRGQRDRDGPDRRLGRGQFGRRGLRHRRPHRQHDRRHRGRRRERDLGQLQRRGVLRHRDERQRG